MRIGEQKCIKFESYFDGNYWCARGIGDILPGKSLDELMGNIQEAVELHYEENWKEASQLPF